MGASNCPETPRQKMIGMMYLVLTAMLALNVSKDILNAFSIIDESLASSTNITERTISSDDSFLSKQEALLGKAKVEGAIKKVAEIKTLSDKMVKEIEEIRKGLLIAVDGTEKNSKGELKTVGEINSKDDTSGPTNFLINEGRAKKLKDALLKYRKAMLDLANDGTREQLNTAIGLQVDADYHNAEGAKETWEDHCFNGTIMAASVTLLNKLVGEVRNAESLLIKDAIAGINAEDFKFSKVEGRAIPKSQMVFSGDAYEADIIVAAFDEKQAPEVYYKMNVDTLTSIEGAEKLEGEDGIAKLKIPTGGAGDFKFAGIIRIVGPDGTPKEYGFADKYTVLPPSATVAAEKMNMFYAGIENPVSVNAPCAPDKINVTMTGGGTITKTGPGTYNVTVPAALRGKTVTVNVSADLGGGPKQMGSTVFRVRTVPDPDVSIGGTIRGGKIPKSRISAGNGFVAAKMDESFAYDLKWAVNSFRVTFVTKGIEDAPIAVQGNKFTNNILDKIKKSPKGTAVYITDIKASSPAGQRTLKDISIRLN